MGDPAAMFHNPSPQPAGAQQKPQARNGMMELQAGKMPFAGHWTLVFAILIFATV